MSGTPRSALALAAALTVCVAAATACGINDSFSSSTLPPMPTSGAGPVAGDGDGPTATPPLIEIDTSPRTPQVIGEQCAFTGGPTPGAPSTLTYVFGDRLFELGADATTAVCLAPLSKSQVRQPLWSPTGESLLLGPSVLMVADGVTKTGFAQEGAQPTWSLPDGEFLYGAVDGRLVRRTAGKTKKTNIDFLESVTALAFYPGGAFIVVAGNAPDGGPVLALATPNGKLWRPLVNLPAGTVVSEIAVSADGLSVAYLAGSVVRSVRLPDLTISTRIQTDGSVGHVVAEGDVVAAQVGDCAGQTSTRMFDGTTTIDLNAAIPFLGRSTHPVGFVAGRLIVASRLKGCEGPADLWAVDPTDAQVPELLISAVELAAVRPAPIPPVEFPPGMPAQAVQG